MTLLSRTASVLLAAALLTASAPWAQIASAATTCQITPPASTVTDRKVTFTMSGCAGVRRFQVSESPTFDHQSGVTINLSNVAADMSTADVSITYAGGAPGGNGTPYSLPEKRTINALAVLYEFADANDKDHGVGAYETPLFLKRFVFGDGIIGYEGYHTYNSFKDHLLQSTAGRVTLTGDTYYKIVHIPLEKFRTFLDTPAPSTLGEIIAAIKRDDPTYFDTHRYDYIFPLASSHYAVERGYQGVGYGGVSAMLDIMPWDKTTSIFASTIEEVRTAHDALRVVQLYNAASVEGVWLLSDTGKTGTNYFTGGSIPWASGTQDNSITLGTPLPSPNAQVIVRYKANAGPSVDRSTANVVTNYGWGGHMWHENYHSISVLPQMKFSQKYNIGDPYVTPSVMPGYDVMQNSSMRPVHPILGSLDGTPLLSAVNKYEMGYVRPYTLAYGENEINRQLARAEFSDIAQIENSTTMIKVPLRKLGDPGLATKQQGIYYNELGVPTDTTAANKAALSYSGEEYLLIELRSKAPLPGGRYNFDEAMQSGGIVVYHVIEQNPASPTLHFGADIAEVVDATPPYLSGHTNVVGSAAAFGPESGVYQLTLQELWQDKSQSSDTHTFDYMLSEGRGPKTLYARFVDAMGNLLGTQTITLTLDSDQTAAQRAPTLTLSSALPRVVANYTAPNGGTFLYYYFDQYLLSDRSLSGASTGSDYYYFGDNSKFPSGSHTIKAVLYDKAKIATTQSVIYSSGTSAGPTATLSASPTTISAGESATLTWSSPNGLNGPTKCTGVNFSAFGFVGTVTVRPTETTTYSVTCTTFGQTSAPAYATVSVTGTVTPPPPPAATTTVSLTASPIALTAGQASTLTWESANATACTGENFTPTGLSGSVSVSPIVTTTYGITCTGAALAASASASIAVSSVGEPLPPAPVPTPTSTPPTLAVGVRVKTTDNLNVRAKANMGKGTKILCTQPAGSLGTIIGGPTKSGGMTFWNVNYDALCDGWSTQTYLTATIARAEAPDQVASAAATEAQLSQLIAALQRIIAAIRSLFNL